MAGLTERRAHHAELLQILRRSRQRRRTFCDKCGKRIEGAPPRLPAIPSPLGLVSRVTALPQPGEFAVDLPEMPSLPSAVSAVKGLWKGGLAFPLVSGLLAGGVPYWQNSRNLDWTQKICYDVACQRQFRAEQVKGK